MPKSPGAHPVYLTGYLWTAHVHCWCSVQNMLQLLDVLIILMSWKNAANSPQYCCFSVSSCLRSWLEQDTSCPTCRMSLNITDSHHVREDHQRENLDENLVPVAVAEGRPRLNQHNHFFHFDGELSRFDIHYCCLSKRREFCLCFIWNLNCASPCVCQTHVFFTVLLKELR